jgi:hypothetical protein
MKRRPRVAGMTSNVWRREIATGVDPAGAVVGALAEFRGIRPGEFWRLSVAHDDGCPSLEGGGMPGCTCELVRLEVRRAA